MDDDVEEYVCESASVESDSEDESINSMEDDVDVDENEFDVGQIAKSLKHLQQAFNGFSEVVGKHGKSTRSSGLRRPRKSLRGRGRSSSSRGPGTSDRPGSRFNSLYFAQKIIAKLDDRKKQIIRHHGFGMLLDYDGCSASKGFVQWIDDQVDLNCSDIVVGGKMIPLDPLSVHLFLGIPIGGSDIKGSYTDSTKSRFLKAIKQPSLPTIKWFGQQLVEETLSDDDVFRYFMVVALSTFMCANSNTYPSPQYLEPLIDISNVEVKSWDWSKYVFNWLFSSIRNYQQKGRGTIGGCRYFLAGYYLDWLNFGVFKEQELPQGTPRIKCWMGSMIKKFASYDRVSGDVYGKRPVKSVGETCYAEEIGPEDARDLFRSNIDRHCDFICVEDRDMMSEIFDSHHTRLRFRSPGLLVAKMFKYMHETHVVRGGGDAGAGSSAGREPCTEPDHVGDRGVGSAEGEFDGPVPSPVRASVRENVLDTTMNPGASEKVAKEYMIVCLTDSEQFCDDIRGYIMKVESEYIVFRRVKDVHLRDGSFVAYKGLDVHVHNRIASPIIESATVSKFIFRHFKLVPGEQPNVVAVQDINYDDKVFLVTRVVSHFFEPPFLLKCKIAYDYLSDSVYLLLENDADVENLTGRSCRVETNSVAFRRVMRMQVSPKVYDFYRYAYCSQSAP